MNDEEILNDMKSEIIAAVTDQILKGLMRQSFVEWHDGRFTSFVEGDLEEFGTESHLIAETLIKRDIQRLFNLI